MKTILRRLSEPTPEFFKKIRLIAIAFIVLLIGLQTAGIPLPQCVSTALKYYTLSIGSVTIFLTSLTSALRGGDGHLDQDKVDQYQKRKIEDAKRMYDK